MKMNFIKKYENFQFMYHSDLEYFFITGSILIDDFQYVQEGVTKEVVEQLKIKYPMLFDIYHTLDVALRYSMMEFLLEFELDSFTINEYHNFILNYSKKEFLSLFFCIYNQDLVNRYFETERGLYEFCTQINNSNISSLYYLVNNHSKIINDFFNLVKDVKEQIHINNSQMNLQAIANLANELEQKVVSSTPLNISQRIMGKTFVNKGPYQCFIFIPCCFLIRPAIRFFNKEKQILFYSIKDPNFDINDLSNILKCLSDEKRLEVLILIKNKEPIRAKELLEHLDLAASTISYHLDQLKTYGLINEEKVKNSKYYSINTNQVNELIESIKMRLVVK